MRKNKNNTLAYVSLNYNLVCRNEGWLRVCDATPTQGKQAGKRKAAGYRQRWWHAMNEALGLRTVALTATYGNAIEILLANTFGLSLALLEGVLVLEFGSHFGCSVGVGNNGSLEDAVCAYRLMDIWGYRKSTMSVERVVEAK